MHIFITAAWVSQDMIDIFARAVLCQEDHPCLRNFSTHCAHSLYVLQFSSWDHLGCPSDKHSTPLFEYCQLILLECLEQAGFYISQDIFFISKWLLCEKVFSVFTHHRFHLVERLTLSWQGCAVVDTANGNWVQLHWANCSTIYESKLGFSSAEFCPWVYTQE